MEIARTRSSRWNIDTLGDPSESGHHSRAPRAKSVSITFWNGSLFAPGAFRRSRAAPKGVCPRLLFRVHVRTRIEQGLRTAAAPPPKTAQ